MTERGAGRRVEGRRGAVWVVGRILYFAYTAVQCSPSSEFVQLYTVHSYVRAVYMVEPLARSLHTPCWYYSSILATGTRDDSSLFAYRYKRLQALQRIKS